ncbi:MAG: protein BatD [Oleiphilaceae bacterium]|nr:protein BatD [Oleiphilaceae bacterium]
MVNRIIALVTLIILLAAPVMAASKLSIQPDRTSLYDNETLKLTVTGEMELSVNFDTLFNLGNLDLPAPDLDKLQNDFEILSRSQRYNVRAVNGATTAEIIWLYELEPLKSGQLTIPALHFNGAESEEVAITVREGTAPDTGQGQRDAFIELATDKDSVYVQEQFRLTVTLFFSGNLIRGELSEPEHPDVIIESLGDQKEYNRTIGGRRFRVVERNYLVYPQESGTLTLNPIRFEGQARSSQGQREFLRDRAQLFEVPVKPVPDEFTGENWLPASELTLSDTGIADQASLTLGESLTQTVTIEARGLPAEALAPLDLSTPDGIKRYAEEPEASTRVLDETVVGTLSQTSAIVGAIPGFVTLPEVRLPWWDTDADTQRVAVIPERTLNVVPGRGGSSDTASSQADAAPQKDRADADQAPPAREKDSGTGFWPWLTGALAIAWAATFLLMRRKSGDTVRPEKTTPIDQNEQRLFGRLLKASESGHPQVLDLLPRWVSVIHPGRQFQTVSDVIQWSGQPALKAELDKLQARHFAHHPGSELEWNGKALTAELHSLRNRVMGSGTQGLPPLYPQSMQP